MNTMKLFGGALFLLMGTCIFAAVELDLKALAPTDFASETIQGYQLKKMPEAGQTEPVSYSYPLRADSRIDLAIRAHIEKSKGFWLPVNQRQLRDGVVLPITEAGALVRIDAVAVSTDGDSGATIEPLDLESLVLVNAEGDSFGGGSGMETLVNAEQLEAAREAGFAFATSAFRVDPNLGSGNLMILSQAVEDTVERRYVIQVYEPDSPMELKVRTLQDTYFVGQAVAVDVSLATADVKVDNLTMSGVAISPSGTRYPIQFEKSEAYGSFRPEQAGLGDQGLWRIEVSAEGNLGDRAIRRDGATAVAVVLPTARLSGKAEIFRTENGVGAGVIVVVAEPGRYEVRGLLYAASEEGLVPVGAAQTAAWLTPGKHQLVLPFQAQSVEYESEKVYFQIKDLRLIHQDRMSLLHRQNLALTFPRNLLD